MRFLIFIPPKDFKDESVSLVKLFFDKWGVRYDISSYTSKVCVGTHGARYEPAVHTSKVFTGDYDGLVLIDGNGIDFYKLYDYRPLLDLVLKFEESKKYIIGIDNAVKVPARANVVRGKLVSANDRETQRLVTLFHGTVSDKTHEIAGNLITIRSYGDVESSMQKILEHIGVT